LLLLLFSPRLRGGPFWLRPEAVLRSLRIGGESFISYFFDASIK
jgi:hypothetical protein